jgi:hypothetical protein
MRNVVSWILFFGLGAIVVLFSQGCGNADNATAESNRQGATESTDSDKGNPLASAGPVVVTAKKDNREILWERQQLDETVWANEVEAQKYETVFVRLWDQIRNTDAAKKLTVLADFPFEGRLSFGTPGAEELLEAGISLTKFQPAPLQTFDAGEWRNFVRSIEDSGVQIVQTEWHHSRFVPASDSSPPKSTISFTIHAIRDSTQSKYAVKGDLEVQWSARTDGDKEMPGVDSIAITGLSLQQRSKGGTFHKLFTAERGPDDWISANPVLVYDLNGDGLSEIVVPRWNRVYWNHGDREFEEGKLLDYPIKIWEAGILADFNGDGNADFVTVGKDGSPNFYAGTEQGKFPTEPVVCANVDFDMPTAITAGDADGDGDLDLWMTQYKLPFSGGQMPTPFYDANDGYPSYFLTNDGAGSFSDVTESAGLGPLRNRRTYSASFIDLDEDGDLDLLNVADYAGLDIYENDGLGSFQLATADFVNKRDFFGMGHTFGDYNNDGLLDFYVIGMSSTTARRLDRLNLGREDRPDVHPMRAAMGYGNRLYFGTEGQGFVEDPEIAAAVARTGWSWGTTSFDFDLDGDLDIYVANGHRSGESCQDYCSTFWRHDIYTGDSKEDLEVLKVFKWTLSDINSDEISWNGYEKNVLFVNHPDRPERFINSSFMFGAAYAFDARSVISDDLDADGWPDLVVAQSSWNGRGFGLSIHVLANEIKTGEANNWFSVRLRESAGPGFSPNGAKVVITDDLGKVQTRWIVSGDSFLAQHALVAHFGLGKAKQVKSIEVTWPNGKTESYDAGSDVNTTITVRGGEVVQ